MSLAAALERWARVRTSEATTAKPLPASPARAASTAALSASRLVWNAISSMTEVMSAMRLRRGFDPADRFDGFADDAAALLRAPLGLHGEAGRLGGGLRARLDGRGELLGGRGVLLQAGGLVLRPGGEILRTGADLGRRGGDLRGGLAGSR